MLQKSIELTKNTSEKLRMAKNKLLWNSATFKKSFISLPISRILEKFYQLNFSRKRKILRKNKRILIKKDFKFKKNFDILPSKEQNMYAISKQPKIGRKFNKLRKY